MEPAVIAEAVKSIVFGAQTAAGSVMVKSGFEFTTAFTCAVSVQPAPVVTTIKYAPESAAAGVA